MAEPTDTVMMLLIVRAVAGWKQFRNTRVNPWASGKTPKQNRYGHDALDRLSGGWGGSYLGILVSTRGRMGRWGVPWTNGAMTKLNQNASNPWTDGACLGLMGR